MQKVQSIRKTVAIGIIGNVLEWYDLTIYGYFSPVIAKLFFPNENPLISLIAAFGIFAAGFLVRPLGAVIFGMLGDRIGRKNALFISIVLIAVPTFLMGLMPTYAQIGLWAPLLLTVLRLLQGLSVGGEFSSSLIYLTENAPASRRGFTGSWIFFGSGLGWLLGSFVSAKVNQGLSPEEVMAWGWRLPFLFGLLTGFFGFYLRYFSRETSLFETLKRNNALATHPVKESLQHSKRGVAITIGLAIFSTIGGYIVYAYMPTHLTHATGMPLADALMINTISLAVFTLLIPFSGMLSDMIGRRTQFMISCTGMILFAVPLFSILHQGHFNQCLGAMLSLTVLMALFQGPFPAMMHELFPTRVRASAIAISYNVTAALFAGTAPLVCTLLIKESGSLLAPAFYLMLAATVTLTVLLSQTRAFQLVASNKTT
jgi:MHS family proline/betaine transporter-like MFS transporter